MSEIKQLAMAEAYRRGILNDTQKRAMVEYYKRNPPKNDWVARIVEPALTMATGAIAEPVSGLVGMTALPFGVDAATNTINKVQNAMTYQPRTEAGQEGLQAVGETLAPVGEAIQGAETYLGDTAYNLTGSPAIAAGAASLPTMGMELLGLKGARAIPGKQYQMGDIGQSGLSQSQKGAVGGFKGKLFRGTTGTDSGSGITWATPDKNFAQEYADFQGFKQGKKASLDELDAVIDNPVEFYHAEQRKPIGEFLGDITEQMDSKGGNFSDENLARKQWESISSKFGETQEINQYWQDPEVAEFISNAGFDAVAVPEGGAGGVMTYGIINKPSSDGGAAMSVDIPNAPEGRVMQIQSDKLTMIETPDGRIQMYNPNREEWKDVTDSLAGINAKRMEPKIVEAGGREAWLEKKKQDELDFDKKYEQRVADRETKRLEEEQNYKMQHQAPMLDDNPSGVDLNDVFPDIYTPNGLQYYGTGAAYDQKAINVIKGMQGNPNKQVTIYRAVPKEVTEINASDWVTTTREYAADHMEGEKGWHILSKKVKAKDIASDGNSIHEFGYDPQ
jgi:hypothetical protein